MSSLNKVIPRCSFLEGPPRADIGPSPVAGSPDVTPNGEGRRGSPLATGGNRGGAANEEATRTRNAKTTAVCLGRELGKKDE